MSRGIRSPLLAGIRACVAIACLLQTASPSGLVWSYPSQTQTWIPKAVSLGDVGTQVFADFDGYNYAAPLLSGFDGPGPSPIWQATGPYFGNKSCVDSAALSNMHAAIRLEQATAGAPVIPVLSKYRSNAPTPDWTYSFPFATTEGPLGVQVTPSGDRIVAWAFEWVTQITHVRIFAAGSSTPLFSISVPLLNAPHVGMLSGDGTSFLLVTNPGLVLIDVHTGAVNNITNYTLLCPSGHSISADASTIARALQWEWVMVHKRVAGTYQWLGSVDLGASAYAPGSALDANGSTLALGVLYGSPPYLEMHVRVLDLTNNSLPTVFEDVLHGQGIYEVTVTGMSFSSDGKTLAVTTSGDQAGLVPEVLVYQRSDSGTWSRSFAYNLPGSALSMQLSRDGRRLVVGSKAVHMNQMGNGGRIDLFELDAPDLELLEVPHVGATVHVQQTLAPNTPCRLFAADAPAASPLTFGVVGTLYLNRISAHPVSYGVSDANGRFTTAIQLTSPAFQIGTTQYYQALSLAPRRLSQSWVAVTVLP